MMILVFAYIAVYLLYWSIRWVIGTAHFIWFDLWVGIYVDAKKRRTYWAGLPCFVIIEEW